MAISWAICEDLFPTCVDLINPFSFVILETVYISPVHPPCSFRAFHLLPGSWPTFFVLEELSFVLFVSFFCFFVFYYYLIPSSSTSSNKNRTSIILLCLIVRYKELPSTPGIINFAVKEKICVVFWTLDLRKHDDEIKDKNNNLFVNFWTKIFSFNDKKAFFMFSNVPASDLYYQFSKTVLEKNSVWSILMVSFSSVFLSCFVWFFPSCSRWSEAKTFKGGWKKWSMLTRQTIIMVTDLNFNYKRVWKKIENNHNIHRLSTFDKLYEKK